MEKQHKNPTKEESIKNENINSSTGKNSTYDIAIEIISLLNDYFCGNFIQEDNGILMELVDGKVFRLSISEVA